ncbi:Ovate family protein 5 [Hibiscus syriacus]|uniref:Ovate family protein 5 n=1 Tax=Hibiscus syriacus TaxID=106335 RepID=A0A6A3BUM0_HIBSY|nr:Ovate family protein 5 [Hibiscus syriacus]
MRKDRRPKMKGRVSRIGSYAIASSMKDHTNEPCITCTTFNILAPIYKRLSHKDQNCRESDYRAYWLARNQRILDSLLDERSSIICLQEFWVGNEELVNMYEKRLGVAGYLNFKHGRTNNRGDALLTAVHKDYLRVINYRELHFNDCGDRVAQLLHVELATTPSQRRNNDPCREILIVNTHLLFPHDSSLCIVRLHQVYKILQYVESYQKDYNLNPLPIMLCGDWNGSKRGHVYKFLRSQGFVSSYDTAHRYTDADAHKNQLRKASLTEDDAFAFLKADNDGDYITYSGFCEALRQFNIIGHRHGLSVEETKELWVQADIDGNGVVDYKEFQQRIWKPTWSESRDGDGKEGQDRGHKGGEKHSRKKQAIGFSVKNAVLFPPEVEKGMWPENYFLSDHARLTETPTISGTRDHRHAILSVFGQIIGLVQEKWEMRRKM